MKNSLPFLGLGALLLAAAALLTGRGGNLEPAVAAGKKPVTTVQVPAGKQVATLAAGCFWSMESTYKLMKGVDSVYPGYAGGTVANPTYEQVCSGNTGHAEAVNIIYDPKVISFKDLVKVILICRDPTTLNRQGPDSGTQYRSAIFTHSPEQEKEAKAVIKQVEENRTWPSPIVTAVEPFTNFYRAEDYHLGYAEKHPNEPYIRQVVQPEIDDFKEKFAAKLR